MAQLSSGPICYYVYEADAGWTVALDNERGYSFHPKKEQALAMARDAAEALWLITRKASCVRVGRSYGQSLLDRTYGI